MYNLIPFPPNFQIIYVQCKALESTCQRYETFWILENIPTSDTKTTTPCTLSCLERCADVGVSRLVSTSLCCCLSNSFKILTEASFDLLFKNLDCASFRSLNACFSRCSREAFGTRLLCLYLIFSFS